MSKTIGITGGIGAGKSIVCKLLKTLGYPVFDSDAEAKRLMHTTLKKDILELFGPKAYKNNTLNRAYIADVVFEDNQVLAQLNAIVHPAVREAFDQFSKASEAPLVFNEAAILFETGAHKNFDAIVFVTAAEETRIKRVMQRDNVSKDQVRKRMDKQWSDERKQALTPFVINNNTDQLIIPQTLSVINQLISS